jgi:cell division protein FtsB
MKKYKRLSLIMALFITVLLAACENQNENKAEESSSTAQYEREINKLKLENSELKIENEKLKEEIKTLQKKLNN